MEQSVQFCIIGIVKANSDIRALLSSALVFSLLSPLFTHHAQAKPFPSRAPDVDYIPALAAANRFLQAWQMQDQEAGLMMLTDAAKQSSSEERLQTFFSPGPDAAYEISPGKKLKAGRYSFPVALYQSVPGKPGQRVRLWHSQLVVMRAGKNEWGIGKLP